MHKSYLHINKSLPLAGTVALTGAKNAVLVIMASILLTRGKSTLYNVPGSADVLWTIVLLEQLGALVEFDKEHNTLSIDTTFVSSWYVPLEIMSKMRASILVMGPLLATFKKAEIAMPGGCVIGPRPIDLHLFGFKKMGVTFEQKGDYLYAHTDTALRGTSIVLDYPSVGATENILMAAVKAHGTTRIVNAALEPEVIDLIEVLKKMGARITVIAPSTLEIHGVEALNPIEHTVIMDRLEAGTLLLAAAITGGSISIPDAPAFALEAVTAKLEEMGHTVQVGEYGKGITLYATKTPRAVSFKTGPYPSFPTDLQAPMMALQCLAEGSSTITETVYENRFGHIKELQNMGASITQPQTHVAVVVGVATLYGKEVTATDIRSSCALMLAGLVAEGQTSVSGIVHWKRGYDNLEHKLKDLGASAKLVIIE